jgi:tetratricopeptide (TPR) repeat protein
MGAGKPELTMAQVDRLSVKYGYEGRYMDLIRLGRQALEEGMEYLGLHQRMATAYRALGRYEGAIPHTQRALAMYPGSSEIRSQLYSDLIACQRYQEAGWLYRNPTESPDSSLRWHTDLALVHAGYTHSGNYNNLVNSALSAKSLPTDSLQYYYSLRDRSQPYAEATLQGPSVLSGLGWGWSMSHVGHWVFRSQLGYNQFHTYSTGLVQTVYRDLQTLLLRDTVLKQPYANTSRQYSQLMDFQSLRMPAWRWSAGWSLFEERASYFSSQLEGYRVSGTDTVFGGLVGLDFPYRHRAYAGVLGAAYRLRSAELRAGIGIANLNSDTQRQFDFGLTLWPLGNPALQMCMEASFLKNSSNNAGNNTENGIVAVRCAMAPAILWQHANGRRFHGQSPGLWLEASYTGGANLRNYTRPATLWALNSYENIRSIVGLSMRWKFPAESLSRPGGHWWLSISLQIHQRDQSYVTLPWQKPPDSENPGIISTNPKLIPLPNQCQFWSLSLLRIFP